MKALTSANFKFSDADPCLLFKRKDEQFVIVTVYVDDCMIMVHAKLVSDTISFFTFKLLNKRNWDTRGLPRIKDHHGQEKRNRLHFTTKPNQEFGIEICRACEGATNIQNSEHPKIFNDQAKR